MDEFFDREVGPLKLWYFQLNRSNHHFTKQLGWFTTAIFQLRVYHHPKGTFDFFQWWLTSSGNCIWDLRLKGSLCKLDNTCSLDVIKEWGRFKWPTNRGNKRVWMFHQAWSHVRSPENYHQEWDGFLRQGCSFSNWERIRFRKSMISWN